MVLPECSTTWFLIGYSVREASRGRGATPPTEAANQNVFLLLTANKWKVRCCCWRHLPAKCCGAVCSEIFISSTLKDDDAGCRRYRFHFTAPHRRLIRCVKWQWLCIGIVATAVVEEANQMTSFQLISDETWNSVFLALLSVVSEGFVRLCWLNFLETRTFG